RGSNLSERPLLSESSYRWNDRNWSMSDRQLFPPTVVPPALKTTGGYPFLPAGKPTFRNRPRPDIPANRVRRIFKETGMICNVGLIYRAAETPLLTAARSRALFMPWGSRSPHEATG
ncbi:hypothetical protein PX699_00005, partial [Sphingobium sp. H39-3-25]|uniref:hypothetical protein n=1 Tax=Sphingobium arseniciresistens TaxID=3030834 RepID=UPI0023B9AB6D|nr:hypothetical protein [Sphingobium arseniciresistens]